MSGTRTIYVDLAGLERTGHGALLVRLMMAANDICIANQCLSRFEESCSAPVLGMHVVKGAQMYFLRLEWGHLHEALKLIQEFKNTQELLDFLKMQCSRKSQAAFDKLVDCLRGGSNQQRFTRAVSILRSKTAFHYDENMAANALADRAAREEARRSKITLGTEGNLWRYHVADDLVDSIVCRQIWNIPRSANLIESAKEISVFAQHLARDYREFCGGFLVKFLESRRVLS